MNLNTILKTGYRASAPEYLDESVFDKVALRARDQLVQPPPCLDDSDHEVA